MKTLFETIQAAGIEHSNHESDLYLPVTPEVTAILKSFPNVRPTRFKNQITGTMWYDVPFAFQPWWEKRSAAAMGRSKSPAKKLASIENGKKGGRPSHAERYPEFIRGFASTCGCDDAQAHWSAFSIGLTDKSRRWHEMRGFSEGEKLGRDYAAL